MQYFIGYLSYSNEEPFDPSLFVHFRERISEELVNKVNREVVRRLRELARGEGEKKNLEAEREEPKNQGKLILDGTYPPADISYPTDLKLLNQARVHTEKILDLLYEPLKEKIPAKPRTYRQIAKKEYLKVAKQRRSTRKEKKSSEKTEVLNAY